MQNQLLCLLPVTVSASLRAGILLERLLSLGSVERTHLHGTCLAAYILNGCMRAGEHKNFEGPSSMGEWLEGDVRAADPEGG